MYRFLFFIALLFCFGITVGQTKTVAYNTESELIFSESYVLPVSIKCSRKEVKRQTNDSTYLDSKLLFRRKGQSWDSIAVKMRVRGNFRKKTCYYPPLKLKLKKSKSKSTPFENEKLLKVVLPCLNEEGKNDNVLKEYLVYKLYEIVSPYYFETRLLDIDYEEIRNKRTKKHQIKGFFVEDDSKVAKRLNGKVVKRRFYPQSFDHLSAVRNAMFHFMIGNTDFSATHSHNCKAMYIDKKYVPVSYDFDMAGLVNTSYAVVSKTRRYELPIEHVTQRYYMGYQRDYKYFEEVRQELMTKKPELMAVIDDHRSYFENPNNYKVARKYLESFFQLIADEKSFKRKTFNKALKL